MGKEGPEAFLTTAQREFFRILDEFFLRATGQDPESFASIFGFGAKVRSSADALATRAPDAFRYISEALTPYYLTLGTAIFRESKKLVGVKLVFGGSSHFGESQFDAARKMLLYADTVLIPDPILPWLESVREGERFHHTRVLQEVHALLRLKPLIDADLPYPAVLVFPSFEKLLEENDPATHAGIQALILVFTSQFLGRPFSEMAELNEYAATHQTEFLKTVGERNLFVGPDAAPAGTLSDAVAAYRKFIETWRSPQFVELSRKWSDGILVLNGILERLSPQYHLLENAQELVSQPLLCLDVHWHYYNLCCQAFEERLEGAGFLDKSAVSALRSLNSPGLNWLGNVSIRDLVRLREENENREFRRRFDELAGELRESAVGDLERVTAKVSRDLNLLVSEHQKVIGEIRARYDKKHVVSGLSAAITIAAQFVPSLAPLLGSISPAIVAGKYVADKIQEVLEERRVSRSLLGVLAAAKAHTRSTEG